MQVRWLSASRFCLEDIEMEKIITKDKVDERGRFTIRNYKKESVLRLKLDLDLNYKFITRAKFLKDSRQYRVIKSKKKK